VVKELQPGDPQVIGPYRLVGRLGQGGMGQVFLGVSPGGRPVAVKAIRPELASDPQFRTRFGREVTSARKVSGVFTAMVVGADVDGPIAWLATAYVPGPSLAEAVDEQGPLPEASLLTLAGGLAEALSAIHAAGVTHRDLKPSNVLLAEDGPRVIDFGISRAAESTQLTQTGLTIGSPGFMSPEQAVGSEVGPPSDIFSLGTVLAFAATGKGPFGGGTTASLLYRVVHEAPDLEGVPEAVRPLIERCLVKDPAQRPTADDLLAAVGALQPEGNWLPDSVVRMFAAPAALAGAAPTSVDAAPADAAPAATSVDAAPAATSVDGAPAATSVDAGPAPTSVDGPPVPAVVPVPDFAATQTAMASSHPTPAHGNTGAAAGGSPPPALTDPASGGGGRPRRRSRSLVLAAVIGVLVLGGAGAAFALSSHGHTTTPAQSPAAHVSSVTSTAKSASHPKPSKSASSSAVATQPVNTYSATYTSTSPTPTTTTSPTPTTTTSPTPTTTTTTSSTPTTTTTTSSTPTTTATG
jgi:eukaryotic-like serine/threonine-protein kinase